MQLLGPLGGHVGDGNFHVMVLVDENDAAARARAEVFHERLILRALRMGGTCTGEHGIGTGKQRFLVQEATPVGIDLMRRIKAAFDPQGLMNPGKIFSMYESRRCARLAIVRSRRGECRSGGGRRGCRCARNGAFQPVLQLLPRSSLRACANPGSPANALARAGCTSPLDRHHAGAGGELVGPGYSDTGRLPDRPGAGYRRGAATGDERLRRRGATLAVGGAAMERMGARHRQFPLSTRAGTGECGCAATGREMGPRLPREVHLRPAGDRRRPPVRDERGRPRLFTRCGYRMLLLDL